MNVMQDINNLIYTLNQIEVKGESNLDMVSGCIKTLQKMKQGLEEELAKEKEKGA